MMSACAPQVVCEPCTEVEREALTPHERGQLTLRQDPPDLDAVPFRSQEFKALWGEDDSFCAGLPELTPEAVRTAMLKEGEFVITPYLGMLILMVCEDYYNEDRAASLTRYRLLTYLLLRTENEGRSEELDELIRFVAMSGYWEGSNYIDEAHSARILKEYGWEDGHARITSPAETSIDSKIRRALSLSEIYWENGGFSEND